MAHPDDELLWFGSVVSRVKTLVVCFEGVADASIAAGRRRVSEAFPRSARWLRLDEPRTWRRTPWDDPTYFEYGLRSIDADTDRRVAIAFDALIGHLTPLLCDADVIFTHNPWGEYGHADHALVHAAVRSAATARGVRLFCPLVASATSALAMRRQPVAWSDPIRAQVDARFCERARSLYIEHGAWTWYTEWAWRSEDVFAEVAPGHGPAPIGDMQWVKGPLDADAPRAGDAD